MTAKEYLGQAYRLDQRIDSKLELIISLNQLATKCTSIISEMPGSPNRNTSTMADAIAKIIDLEVEINADIDKLVDLKHEIVSLIKAVNNSEYQTLLELRYLCFHTWEQIAVEMHYSSKWIRKLHDSAMDVVDFLIKNKSVPLSSLEFQDEV